MINSLCKTKNSAGSFTLKKINDGFGNITKNNTVKNVLIAEDNKMHSELMKLIIDSSINANVIIVNDGREALDRISSGDYFDLIILDIMMPKINGLDVLKSVRKLYDKMPVLMVSALEDNEIMSKGLALGADSYLVKPINKDVFKQKIYSLLKIDGGNRLC